MSSESAQFPQPNARTTSGRGAHDQAPERAAVEEPINILLVDDEPKNLTVLETVLANPNYRLVRAQSADQALLALIDTEFALLILDINMPNMNGFELAQLIKQRKRTALLPIIFLTAYYSEEYHIVEGYSTGAVDYLHKPISPTVLRSKVAVFADLYRKTRECSVANQALLAEIVERRRTQDELRRLNLELERRVEERTAELVAAIGELQRAEADLRDADRRKDEFLATLAHELRNPLAPIFNALQILRLDKAGSPELQWAKDVIDRQIRQMTHLVDDLLDISRISRGKLELRREPVKLRDAIQGAVETSNPHIQEGRHQLTLDIPSEELILNGDLTRLSQILSNLLNNAAKYTEPGGKIALTADAKGSEVEIRVKDNGVGIPAEMIPQVFEMFAQIDRHLDRSKGGLGIGLRLVKSLVELHGGSIQAASGGAGRGSEFIVRLPLASESCPQEAESQFKSAAQPAESKSSHNLRVLIVDDNQDNAESLRRLLSMTGYDVRAVYDGVEGVRVVEEFCPDVLLLDIGMPTIDGHEVCRRIRSTPWGRNMTVVAQTGWGQEQDRRRTSEVGFDYHLVKPIDHTALRELLQKIGNERGPRSAGAIADEHASCPPLSQQVGQKPSDVLPVAGREAPS
jgi:signal transduction histidine kinase